MIFGSVLERSLSSDSHSTLILDEESYCEEYVKLKLLKNSHDQNLKHAVQCEKTLLDFFVSIFLIACYEQTICFLLFAG